MAFKPVFEFPDDCLKLVHSEGSFIFPEWENSLGSAQLFRISGVTDALSKVGLASRKYVEPLKIISESVDDRIPDEWKEFYNTGDAWKRLGGPQITHVQKFEAQTFDKALLSVMFVAEFIERVLHLSVPDDFLELVKIVPIMYILEVEDSLRDNWQTGGTLEAELTAAIHINPSDASKFFDQAIVQQRRLAWRTAQTCRDILKEKGHAAEIHCKRTKRPKAIEGEKLFWCRQVEHEPVGSYLRGTDGG